MFFLNCSSGGGGKRCNKMYDLLISLSFQMWLFLRPSFVGNASVTSFLADFILTGSFKIDICRIPYSRLRSTIYTGYSYVF